LNIKLEKIVALLFKDELTASIVEGFLEKCRENREVILELKIVEKVFSPFVQKAVRKVGGKAKNIWERLTGQQIDSFLPKTGAYASREEMPANLIKALKNDAIIIEKLAHQQTIINELYNVIDNIALELSNVSTTRQKPLLNRLDMMLEKINNYDNIPSIIPTTIVSIKVQYLDSLSSDEILDWLKKYRSFLLAEDYSKQVQKIKKKELSKRLENPNEGLQWLKDNIDNMTLAEVNVFFDWYNNISKPLRSQTQEIVRQGKQKMLAKIRQETIEEASNLVLDPPELRELLSEGGTRLVGTGANGIVLESKQANTVIKISHSGDTERTLLREVNNHADFQNAILSGKLARTPDGNQCVPDWVHVPDIYQKPNPTATDVRKRAYIMELVTGMTLKRWVYLKLDEYWSKLEPFTDQ